jgi:hypothetical protein
MYVYLNMKEWIPCWVRGGGSWIYLCVDRYLSIYVTDEYIDIDVNIDISICLIL